MLDCLCIKCCNDVEVWVIHSFVLTASEKPCRFCKNDLLDFYFSVKVLFVKAMKCQAPTIKKILKLLIFIGQSWTISLKEAAKNKRNQSSNSKLYLPVPEARGFLGVTSCILVLFKFNTRRSSLFPSETSSVLWLCECISMNGYRLFRLFFCQSALLVTTTTAE